MSEASEVSNSDANTEEILVRSQESLIALPLPNATLEIVSHTNRSLLSNVNVSGVNYYYFE